MSDYIKVPFEKTPHGPDELILEKKTYLTNAGFGTTPSIYPVTIVQSRYNGTYEGGMGSAGWLAFPVAPHILATPNWWDWAGSDIPCSQWWDRAFEEHWPIGRGPTPEDAHHDLIEQVCAQAGVDPASLMSEPTFERSKLTGFDAI